MSKSEPSQISKYESKMQLEIPFNDFFPGEAPNTSIVSISTVKVQNKLHSLIWSHFKTKKSYPKSFGGVFPNLCPGLRFQAFWKILISVRERDKNVKRTRFRKCEIPVFFGGYVWLDGSSITLQRIVFSRDTSWSSPLRKFDLSVALRQYPFFDWTI